jgi:predicted MPP superfamily phosphohydrolase
MSDAHVRRQQRKKAAKFRRARIRHFIFTSGPNRLSGGRISRRHLSQDVIVREIEIASPLWPSEFDGMRIGHVSDFHLGELLPLTRALQVVDQLAAQEPDLVACTGDVVDLHHHDAAPLLKAMADIGAPLGSALVLGNHDELHCADTVSRLAVESGMTLLRNDVAQIQRNGRSLTIAGIDWAPSASACAQLIDRTCSDTVNLLLAHNPRAFPRAAERDIALTLSGHTHGGQIAMKNRRNANLALGHRHRAGLFEDGPSRLYVTSGVGAWFPLRVNCPAEIAMITMKHQPPTEAQKDAAPAKSSRRKTRR